MNNEIQCYHCEQPIISRRDLIVSQYPSIKMNPLHEACYNDIVEYDDLKLVQHPVINRDTPKVRKLWRFKFGLFSYPIEIALVLTSFIIAIYLISYRFEYWLLLLLAGIWGFLLARRLLNLALNKYSMKEMKKKSWERYESKLPE